jgi:hypothetical protein
LVTVSDLPDLSDLPEPEHPYAWRNQRERDCDALALLALAQLGDYDAAKHLLATLDAEQMAALCWVLACWWSWAPDHDARRIRSQIFDRWRF